MVPRSVSIFDIKLIPGAIGIIQRNNKEEVEQLLWQVGFDPKLGFEFVDCLHRPLTAKTNEPVLGVRIEGYERFDHEWLSSDNASWEAKTENIDPELRDDLIAMSQESRNTAFICEHIANSKGE